MNKIKKTGRVFIAALVLLTGFSSLLIAQDRKTGDSQLKDLIDSRHYIFNAESVLPTGDHLRFLNSGEQVVLNGDSLAADLPYFGRAYTAPVDPSQGGFHFTSVNFQYTVEEKKKGGWTILIKPTDNRDVQQLTLDISENGKSSLQVISNSRQTILFNGRITGTVKK